MKMGRDIYWALKETLLVRKRWGGGGGGGGGGPVCKASPGMPGEETMRLQGQGEP